MKYWDGEGVDCWQLEKGKGAEGMEWVGVEGRGSAPSVL